MYQDKKFYITSELHKTIKHFAFEREGIDPNKRQYNYYYIIHKIITNKTFHKGAYKGSKLNTDFLSDLFGKSKADTCSIIKDLVSWGCIVLTKKAEVGKTAACYSIHDDYATDKVLILLVNVSDVGFIKKLLLTADLSKDKVLKALSNNCNLLTLNKAGLCYLANKYNLNALSFDKRMLENSSFEKAGAMQSTTSTGGSVMLEQQIEIVDLPLVLIYLRDFNTSRPDVLSRVYNNLTNLKREHRRFIHFNGKDMLMTDISNCQVLLSVAAVKKQYSIMSGKGLLGLPEDVRLYQELAESGQFYEYLIQRTAYQGDRNQFKKDFFSQVFFSKVVKYSMAIKDAFIKEFPSVYRLISQLKVKNYKGFAISMQRLEANIMVDQVAKGMIKNGKNILTLHDAIVTDCVDSLILAEELITKAMLKSNISPKFKRESDDIDFQHGLEPIESAA